MSAITPIYELYQESTWTLVTPGVSLSLAGRTEAIIIELFRVIAVPSEP
jgi:hypothetical protein